MTRGETSYKDSISLKEYFKEIRKLDIIDGKEQIKLAVKARNGDAKSMKKLVESNLRFVISVAKDYVHTGVPLEDLISEGNLGLIKAIGITW